MDFRGVMAICFEIPVFFDSPCRYLNIVTFRQYLKFRNFVSIGLSDLVLIHLHTAFSHSAGRDKKVSVACCWIDFLSDLDTGSMLPDPG